MEDQNLDILYPENGRTNNELEKLLEDSQVNQLHEVHTSLSDFRRTLI